jgi:protein TonB
MKRPEQLKYASPDGLASDHIEPVASATGTICLAADINRPQPDLWTGISVLDLPGIIPFIWREQADEPEVPPIVANRSWIPPPPASDRGLWMGAAVVSVVLHTSVLLFFVEKLAPRASIGVEVISVDLVLGADAEAGFAPTPSRSEASSAPKEDHPEDQVSEREPDEAQFREASPVVREVAKQRVKDDVSEPRPVTIADEAPTVIPDVAVTRNLVEPPPERIAHSPGREAPAPPRQEAETTPAKHNSKNVRDSRAPSAVAQSASNSIGRGRSDDATNYRGIIAAHLARRKQFPADARGRGDEGNPAVTFTIDGGGRVVSIRLAHSAGIASLDQEVEAMVRRASPFPAPPSGHAMTFTVPVSFQLR